MAYWAGSIRQLLFGVSQQIPKDRLDGQVEEQVNMTSDLVTGPRRRAPVRTISRVMDYTDPARLAQDNTNIGGTPAVLLVDTVTGTLVVADETTGTVLHTVTNSYLQAAKGSDIRMVTLSEEVFICNVSVKPTTAPWPGAAGLPDPTKAGYLYVVAGAFSKEYTLSVTNQTTGTTTSVDYTTPSSDPATAQPEAIITQLRTLAAANATIGTAAGVTYTQSGAYLYISAPFPITVSTDSGSAYIRGSNDSSIRDSSELPARLPGVADGYIIAVGATEAKTYYRWTNLRKRWIEDAKTSTQVTLTNMPLRLREAAGVYTLEAPEYERRASGDSTSNPSFKFTQFGITGLSAIQGRLVILSNEYVAMSGSNQPLRWYRSSVATLVDDDPIEVAASAAIATPYEYALQFNKDLVLFAQSHQGIVPGAGILTPRSAVATVATRYTYQPGVSPVQTGRTIFYPSPRSQGFSGIWEMAPSQFTDTQVQADDSTGHIPRYIQGPVRLIAASTTTNIVVIGTAIPNELIVHEYLWQGAEKAHASWHRWEFAHPVLAAYFAGDRLICLFGIAGEVVLCEIDLRVGAGAGGATVGRLDFSTELTCTVAGQLSMPLWMYSIHDPDDLWLFKTGGDNAYLKERVLSVSGTDPVVLSAPAAEVGDVYTVGSLFESVLTPTRPILKDQNGVPITTERTQLHRLVVSLENTGELTFTIEDAARAPFEYTTTPLRLFSQELGAGTPLAASAPVNVPCRVDMQSAIVSMRTRDVYDMNVTSLEYGFRYNQRYRRQ
jgi:hypothetical protein